MKHHHLIILIGSVIVLAAPAMAGVELHHVYRQLEARVLAHDGAGNTEGVFNYTPETPPISVTAELDCTVSAGADTDVLVDADGLRLVGAMDIHISRDEVGEQQLCRAENFLEIVFSVDETCTYELAFADVTDDMPGRVFMIRTDTAVPLLWEPIADGVVSSGELEPGGTYCFWIDLSREVQLIQHYWFDAAFSVELEVVDSAVAIETITLSGVKALFD